MEKVMITLPNDLLEAVDLAARQRSESRSQFIRETLAERLEHLRCQAFEALLAEEYGFFAQEIATIVEESLPAQATAAEKVWQRDRSYCRLCSLVPVPSR